MSDHERDHTPPASDAEPLRVGGEGLRRAEPGPDSDPARDSIEDQPEGSTPGRPVVRRAEGDVAGDEEDLPDPLTIFTPEQLAGIVQIVRTVEVSQSWVGPMPAPERLREYEEIVPGSAERILRMAESMTTDESAREDRLVNAEIESARFGRRAAAGLTVAFLAGAITFFALDNVPAGAVLLSVPVAMILRSFFVDLRGRRSGSPEAGE